jgi:hypothetical protein
MEVLRPFGGYNLIFGEEENSVEGGSILHIEICTLKVVKIFC